MHDACVAPGISARTLHLCVRPFYASFSSVPLPPSSLSSTPHLLQHSSSRYFSLGSLTGTAAFPHHILFTAWRREEHQPRRHHILFWTPCTPLSSLWIECSLPPHRQHHACDHFPHCSRAAGHSPRPPRAVQSLPHQVQPRPRRRLYRQGLLVHLAACDFRHLPLQGIPRFGRLAPHAQSHHHPGARLHLHRDRQCHTRGRIVPTLAVLRQWNDLVCHLFADGRVPHRGHDQHHHLPHRGSCWPGRLRVGLVQPQGQSRDVPQLRHRHHCRRREWRSEQHARLPHAFRRQCWRQRLPHRRGRQRGLSQSRQVCQVRRRVLLQQAHDAGGFHGHQLRRSRRVERRQQQRQRQRDSVRFCPCINGCDHYFVIRGCFHPCSHNPYHGRHFAHRITHHVCLEFGRDRSIHSVTRHFDPRHCPTRGRSDPQLRHDHSDIGSRNGERLDVQSQAPQTGVVFARTGTH